MDLVFEENDLPYEENLIQNAYNVKAWLRYIEFKKDSPPNVVYMLYERALKQLPGSYKIWYRYLKLRRIHARRLCVGSLIFEETNNAHERALVTMHKMPRIWHDYLQFLMYQGFITRTRRTMDRALRSLPVTQHQRIWRLYLRFADKHGTMIKESCTRIYRRYIKFAPDDQERFVAFLTKNESYNEAVSILADIISDENYSSREGKSKFQLWQELCKILIKNPNIISLKADPIIRQGISRYTDQVGVLWNSLAEYYIRSENLVRARDVYMEGLNTVMTVKDFSQIFDAFAEFEESIAQTQMNLMETSENVSEDLNLELNLCLARIEVLMEKRPLLLNSVLLRQNPHNVAEWLQRVELLAPKGPLEQIGTFMEAISSVDPNKATAGRLSTIWIELARLYEHQKQLKEAILVLEKSTGVPYANVNDLASIYCEWAEMELRNSHPDGALAILAKATTAPACKIDYYDRSETVQARVHKSLKLWSMYTDLEESFGTFQTAKAAYDQVIYLRIATPQMIMNYALFLEEHNYFEESFCAYEKGIALFKWPYVYDIWTAYLTKFIQRYGGSKLERTRDLFEQCLEHCPAKFAKNLYLMYARLEEDHGLARRANKIYERATEAVLPEERYEMFNTFIQRLADLHGLTHTRFAYQMAIEKLPEQHARQMCLRFADLERKLGEIDRARAIYAYCSQMSDPRTETNFWQTWKEFEIAHGNEDTLREMLRIKRSVQATYNTKVSFMVGQMAAQESLQEQASSNEMDKLNKDALSVDAAGKSVLKGPLIAFHSAGIQVDKSQNGTAKDNGSSSVVERNQEEIDIDEDDDINNDEEFDDAFISSSILGKRKFIDDEGPSEKKILGLEKQAIPAEVFGGLCPEEDD